jgi:hypothetical protein
MIRLITVIGFRFYVEKGYTVAGMYMVIYDSFFHYPTTPPKKKKKKKKERNIIVSSNEMGLILFALFKECLI